MRLLPMHLADASRRLFLPGRGAYISQRDELFRLCPNLPQVLQQSGAEFTEGGGSSGKCWLCWSPTGIDNDAMLNDGEFTATDVGLACV